MAAKMLPGENASPSYLQNSMTDAAKSTYRKLADLQATGEHYKVRTPRVRGTFVSSFCRPEAAEQFVGRLDDLIAAGDIIKDGLSATISRVSWLGHNIVIKRYNNQGFVHSLRHMLKGSRARRVWLYGHLLDDIAVATPPPLACIEVYWHHLLASSYIVTAYINAANLHHFVRDKNTSAAVLREVLIKVAGFLDTMARHGITHGDLKHSNILVADSGPVFTDLDSLMIHRFDITRRRWRQRDIDRFMRSAAMDDLPQATKDLCKGIFGQMTGQAPCSDDYETARIRQWSLTIKRGISPDDAISVSCGDSDVSSSDKRTRYVSSSDSASVFISSLPCLGKSRDVYVKHFLPRSLLDQLKHLFRASRAARAFEASLLLRRNSFDSPEPLALLEKRYGPFGGENVLVTGAVAEALRPSSYLEKCRERPSPARTRDKRLAIRQLGHVVGRMHAKGIFHGDLRLDNVLLQSGDGGWKFYFIDNERTRQFRSMPERLRRKNLVQLNMIGHGVTGTDRVRFFTSYAKAAGLSADRKRKLVADVVRLTHRRLRIREEHHAGDA
jgi:tRNA A-37 threonylcarbamoyl transferase component Bud32